MTSPSNRQNQLNKKIIKTNNINSYNSSANSNKYSASNNKAPKKENPTKNNNMNNSTNNAKKISVLNKNDIKNSKKSDYFKTKNSGIKYEDKFFMMKEDDELDRQKYNKYNYNNLIFYYKSTHRASIIPFEPIQTTIPMKHMPTR